MDDTVTEDEATIFQVGIVTGIVPHLTNDVW